MKCNGTEVQSIRYNGMEVNAWVHNGKEVYSGKKQIKYICKFYSDSGGNVVANVKRYAADDNSLLSEKTISTVSGGMYEDDCIRIRFQELSVRYRYVFTPLVAGTTSVQGAYNYGSDYGGTGNQICPYTLEGNTCTITFMTSGKHSTS